MSAGGRQDVQREPSASAGQAASIGSPTERDDAPLAPVVGSPEHLQSAFARAAAVADRAVGLWLARNSDLPAVRGTGEHPIDGVGEDWRALRALVRAAATAYARRLRAEGAAPERMLVLVKSATTYRGSPGFGAQELTNDIVRWSIEAYFDE